MAYELVRTIIQKILQDKILLGLVIVGLLAFFVGGMTMSDDKPDAKTAGSPEAAKEASAQQPAQAAGAVGDPNLASDFVKWWINGAMDYNANTAVQSHNEAMAWMTPDAQKDFLSTFWSPTIAQSVQTGQLIAAFQPTTIQAQAINPDGSVVVGVMGTVVIQANGQPVATQFMADFLVRKQPDGLRVAGLYNRTAAPGTVTF